MKLSLSWRPGCVQVVGGRLLEVATAHAVPTVGLARDADEYGTLTGNAERKARAVASRPKEKWIYCEVGDIVQEVLTKKGGKVIAYSYLSGPAINIMRYTDNGPGWFSDRALTGALIDVPTPGPEWESPEAFRDKCIQVLTDAKYGPLDVYAFEIKAPDAEQCQSAGRFVLECFKYTPVDRDESGEFGAHVLGLVVGGKGIVNIHVQPLRHASDQAASGFQVSLVLDAIRAGRVGAPVVAVEGGGVASAALAGDVTAGPTPPL